MFAAPRRVLASSVSIRGLPPRLAMSSRASSRLKLISRHVDPKPFLELNTPFSTERSAHLEDEQGNRVIRKKPQQPKKIVPEVKKTAPEAPKKDMSTQASHPALLIPGPIEFDDAVLTSMSHHR